MSDDVHDAAADDNTQYTFKVRNHNVQRITKLLASEDGKNYKPFDIGKGIDVGETVQLNWNKSTNKSECKWYIKAVYADKSVGEAAKFDFCQEDLVIDFWCAVRRRSASDKGRPPPPRLRRYWIAYT